MASPYSVRTDISTSDGDGPSLPYKGIRAAAGQNNRAGDRDNAQVPDCDL